MSTLVFLLFRQLFFVNFFFCLGEGGRYRYSSIRSFSLTLWTPINDSFQGKKFFDKVREKNKSDPSKYQCRNSYVYIFRTLFSLMQKQLQQILLSSSVSSSLSSSSLHCLVTLMVYIQNQNEKQLQQILLSSSVSSSSPSSSLHCLVTVMVNVQNQNEKQLQQILLSSPSSTSTSSSTSSEEGNTDRFGERNMIFCRMRTKVFAIMIRC